MGGAATGDTSSRASVAEAGEIGGTSSHGVQKIYKNTAPILPETVFGVRLTAH